MGKQWNLGLNFQAFLKHNWWQHGFAFIFSSQTLLPLVKETQLLYFGLLLNFTLGEFGVAGGTLYFFYSAKTPKDSFVNFTF